MNLKPNPEASKARKRVGRGIGSGTGKTCGRGVKGQKSRSGVSIPAWFEGGQNPLYRRIPKKGFFNKFAENIQEVSLDRLIKQLDLHSKGKISEINDESLKKIGFKKREGFLWKIVGSKDGSNKDNLAKLKNIKVNVTYVTAQLKTQLKDLGIEVNSKDNDKKVRKVRKVKKTKVPAQKA